MFRQMFIHLLDRRFPRALFLSAALAATLPLMALVPCQTEFEAARLAVANAQLSRDSQQQVLSKLQSAWTAARSNAPDGYTTALSQLALAKQVLTTTPFHSVPAEQIAKISDAIDAFSACLQSAAAVIPVPVTVRVFSAPDVPAGAGVNILVDDEQRATTADDSTVSVSVSPGDHRFTAVQFVNIGGSASATIADGQPATIDIVLASGDFATSATLKIDESFDGVVSRDFTSFTLHLIDAYGNTVAIKKIVELELTGGGIITNVASRFTIKIAGSAFASDKTGLRDLLLDQFGPYELRLRALDQVGKTWRGATRFDLGRYHATGTILAPSGVTPEGVPLRLTNQRNHYAFWQTSAPKGAITFPAYLPEGPYIVSCEFVQNGMRYQAADAFVLDADKSFSITVKPAIADGAVNAATTATH